MLTSYTELCSRIRAGIWRENPPKQLSKVGTFLVPSSGQPVLPEQRHLSWLHLCALRTRRCVPDLSSRILWGAGIQSQYCHIYLEHSTVLWVLPMNWTLPMQLLAMTWVNLHWATLIQVPSNSNSKACGSSSMEQGRPATRTKSQEKCWASRFLCKAHGEIWGSWKDARVDKPLEPK